MSDPTFPLDTDRESCDLHRRSVLGALAGLGILGATAAGSSSATPPGQTQDGHRRVTTREPTGTDSHHPGHPLFVTVGEKLWNTAWVGPEFIGDRDNLAPGVPSPSSDPENYDADAFTWTVVERPDGSTVDPTYQSSLFEDRPRYDAGRDNVAEFEPDVAGTYVLELDAPDGIHRLTIEALPDPDTESGVESDAESDVESDAESDVESDAESDVESDAESDVRERSRAGGRPRIELDATYDSATGTFTIDTNAKTAPNSRGSPDDLEARFLADDRDTLATADVAVEGTTATIDAAALGGELARVHAVVLDGVQRSVLDTVELSPDGTVHLPNRAPEWMTEGVMYQIFTRSWAGKRGQTTFETLIDGTTADGETGIARGVDYLDELGVDAVWLTPVHPAVSAERELPGGGPHGYDITDFFGIAPDLVPDGMEPLEAYEAFVDACHDRDIKVVLDLVINHGGRWMPEFQDTIASQSDEPEFWPIIEEWDRTSRHFDWFDRIDTPREIGGQVVEPAPHVTGFWNLQLHPNFNFDNVALREYMLAVADFWSGEIGVDGFRCDIAWGVPHSFWKDVREVCRANNDEFLLLDETIPNDPAFAENEFDMHFDTEGFTTLAHAVARGEASGADFFEALRDRANQGFPDHSLFLNAVENHDEFRTLNEAFDGSRADAKRAQRATWAAGVTLPGVPHVYYGQERAISEYAEGRHLGPDDHRDGDVHPGGKQRAFMNWESYDDEHLGYYRSLIETYHDLDVLKPGAALSGAWHNTSNDVLVFGRDASDLDDVSGPDRVVVLVNFDDGPATVYLRPGVGSTDLVSGEDVGVDTLSDARAVEVEEISILETPDLLELGSPIAELDVDQGTDVGPGEYTYPTDEAYTEGAFDLTSFDVRETPDAYQFRASVAGNLKNPWALPEGFSVQHLQVYLQDPDADADAGSTVTREGVNARLAGPHQHRVVVDGEHGARLENHEGTVVADGRVRTNTVTNSIIAEIPKAAIASDVEALNVAPILMGYAPDDLGERGNVTPVNAESGAHAFGGGRDDDANPNVIDLVVDVDESREEALAYTEEDPATVGFVPLVTPFEEVATFDVPTGGGYGPGSYVTPTGDDYYEGAWDLAKFEIHESRNRIRFDLEFAEPLQNPWGFGVGFSHQLPQVYVYDPDTDEPATTAGRTATNVAFEAPYNARVNVNPEAGAGVEDANGDGVTRDVDVVADDRTIRVSVPRDAINWDREASGMAVSAVVCPFDGFGDAGLRTIETEADEHVIGGGTDGNYDPRVMDMVTPEGIDRAEVLSEYDAENPPVLPYVTIGDLTRGDLPTGASGGDEGDSEDEETTDAGTETETEAQDGTPTDPAATEDDVPGLGVASGIAGLTGAALAARRLAGQTSEEDD